MLVHQRVIILISNYRTLLCHLEMPILSRYDAASDAVVPSGLGRYDPSSSEYDSGKLGCNCGLCAGIPGLVRNSQQFVKPRTACSSSNDAMSVSEMTDSESSSSGTSSDDGGERGRVDLTSQRLQSMHAVATNGKAKSMSKYSTNGSSKQRIRKAVEKPICTCQCSVPFRIVLRVAVAFWLLTKQGQDTILWTIQHENPGNGFKKDWFIEGPKFNASVSKSCKKKLSIFYSSTSTSQLTFPGHPCCKVAWMHLLGIGKKRLHRCKRTCFGKDGRSTVGRTLFQLYRFLFTLKTL